jgi:prolyl oligopeptidase
MHDRILSNSRADTSGRMSVAPLALILTTAVLTSIIACAGAERAPSPPSTHREAVSETIHGVEIVDHYRWLEEQESPETRAWIDAQNTHAESLLAGRPSRERIRQRLTELMRMRGGRYFVWKRRAGDDLAILYARSGLEGKDEVLIDPHELSPDHTTDITLLDTAQDGSLLVYGIREGGVDEVDVRVMDVASREDLPDRLPTALYTGVSLTADKSGFYYGVHDREAGTRLYYHAMGSAPDRDRQIFGNGYGPDKWISPFVSDNGRYLLITVYHGWSKSEIHFRDLGTQRPIRPLVDDVDAIFYPRFAGDTLVMQTDWNAPKGRILAVDLEDPARERWREVTPEGSDAISGFSLAGGRLFVHYLHDVSSQIRIYSLEGDGLGEIDLPGIGTAGAPDGRWESNEAFFDFYSYTVPRTTYRYDVSTGRSTAWARDEVPLDSDRFEVRQVWYESKDGTRVPMFLVHRKDLEPDGRRPTLLHGYGGFNSSLTPRFRPAAVLWVEQGGVYAVANIRGGGEFGEEWHRAGMLEKKQNVFDDFIAAAEWLIDNDYTNPSRLAIQGYSNGGLLVGAALTQRPDLFQAVLCRHPDLDMVRYHEFENNNPPALLEYGNASDPEQFKFLYAYSPYQRVTEGAAYPAVLLTSGDADTRVPPLQARKMTALLQWATASPRPILLLYDTRSGHSGGKPFHKVIEDLSLEIAFLFWQLGMERS